MSKSYSFTLPFPPTVNTYWRKWNNRMVISAEGRQYTKDVKVIVDQLMLNQTGFPLTERIKILIDVYPPDRRKRDLGNLEKAIGDSLTKAGFWVDDEQVDDLHFLRKTMFKGGKLEVTVTTM